MPRLLALDELPLSAEDCAIGEVIAGKYLIEGVIGRGSMGVVVRATHLGFDELVALKFIRPEMRKIDGIVSRFAREAKASVRIRNEHAVNVLDVGVADPIGPFFVMEYLEGINLEELVDSQGAFDTATAVKYVLEACEALAAAHAQGIIHRDIKPQNMFLAWQGRLELIKVLDFGISKAALSGQIFGDDLSSGEHDWVMGTPLYMSPEQLRHAPDVDERTDIWSLGAVLYELLRGQPLFSGDTQTQVCRQVLSVDERPVRLLIPGVPEELWDVIERCLSLDKEQRYGNVAELGEALLPFAPAGAVLHVERARAMLGLRPLDLFGPDGEIEDDEIEDIDVDPIEEPEPAPAVASPPPRRRAPTWVELAVPALAGAVIWLGVHQYQLDERAAALSAPQSRAFALRPQPPEAAPAATSAGSTAAPLTTRTGEAAPAPTVIPCAATTTTITTTTTAQAPSAQTPSAQTPSAAGASESASPGTRGATTPVGPAPTVATPGPSAPPAASPPAASPPAATRPAPRRPTLSAPPAASAAPGSASAADMPTAAAPTAADTAEPSGGAPGDGESSVAAAEVRSEPAPRPAPHESPAPRPEPRLEFRLIEDEPRWGRAPTAETASAAPPAHPR